MNPVRRGLVEDPLAWRWSSARWFADRTGPAELDQIRLPSEAEARISGTPADLPGTEPSLEDHQLFARPARSALRVTS